MSSFVGKNLARERFCGYINIMEEFSKVLKKQSAPA